MLTALMYGSMHGNVSFVRNYGLRGGGLILHGTSLFLLTPNTKLSLLHNNARFNGGAIYVVGRNDNFRFPCFFQIEIYNLTEVLDVTIQFISLSTDTTELLDIPAELNIAIVLDNNTAGVAGSALYGGAIDNCISLSTVNLMEYRNSGVLFEQLFHFKGNTSEDRSLISSDASSVCLCHDNEPHCDEHTHNVSVYPGQTLYVAAETYGQRNGVSPAVVYSNFVLNENQEPPELGQVQSTQEVGMTCTPLSYTISSSETSLLMYLSVEESNVEEDFELILVNLLSCPPGFTLAGSPPSCGCNSQLTSFGLTCDIESQTIRRTPPYWISGEDNAHDIIVHQYCPLDYCTDSDVDVDVSTPDSQCANQRTGTLCGACQPGLSAVFGSSKCEKCTNHYIALLPLFLLAGIALVLLLYFCESLHTTVGTINGLIFYANIVQFNKEVFLPPNKTNILTVFVAWLNLDLGVPTCFYMMAWTCTLSHGFSSYFPCIFGPFLQLSSLSVIALSR